MLDRLARRIALVAAALTTALLSGTAALGDAPEIGRTPAPPNARVYFVTPKDGDVLKSPITVRFGLSGMGVAPAGVEKPETGHHHLLIDTPLPDMGMPIPADDHHRHFGGGQTEMQLDLPPGKHTLQLLLGDYRHIPFDPPVVSKRIEITVE